MRKKTISFGLAVLMILGLMSGCGKKSEETATTQAQTTETTEAAVQAEDTEAEKKEEDFFISLTGNSSWENNGMTCTQFDGVIRNQSGESGRDWRITAAVPEGAVVESGWSGTYTVEGTELEITPADYNKEIAAGEEITFGFILDTKTAFTLTDALLTIGDKQYALLDGAVSDKEALTTEENSTTETAEAAAEDNGKTPVAAHGALSVKGTDIVDKNGKIFRLKGVSTHGINWFPDYVNKEAFASLAGYGVNAIRLAMYTGDNNGYCSGGNREELEALIDKGVNACRELGLYVIIDWHILSDNDPTPNKGAAAEFFERMSKKYADNENVIYEICNEPNGGTTWDTVKAYSEEIIPIIRKNDGNALIIVGTPNWSQDVDVASDNPITGQENILYAVHFYAATHKEEIRNKVKRARENGLPVIVSECSICDASGNGEINYDEAERWVELMDEYHLSFFAWNLSNKDEQSSLLKPSVAKTNDFQEEDFSETGAWFIQQFKK
ncbi:MAG: cellulase family glycosylhydrolase [Bacteroidales bacterium]|nr:cellulase family glycosylhydrolase [Clostridium sp.]MCM1203136.1 cellulase family glycosylhydrolase [Bacteroidales bacterium]